MLLALIRFFPVGSIIAVAGDRAGAGATTVVSLVGAALSEQLRQAALVDGTRAGTRLSDTLDVEPSGNLVETLRRGRKPIDARTTGPHDTALFLGTEGSAWDAVPSTSVEKCYDHLRERVEIGLVDLGPITDPSAVPWIGLADELVVVTGADEPQQVDALATIAATFDVSFRGVVVNRVAPDRLETTVRAWTDNRLPLLAVLPDDEVASVSAEAGESILTYDPDSQLSTLGWQLAERLASADEDEPIVPDAVSTTTEAGDAPKRDSGSSTRPDTDSATERSGGAGTPAAGTDTEGASSSSTEAEPGVGSGTAGSPEDASGTTGVTNDATASVDIDTDTTVDTDDLQAGDSDPLTDTVDDSLDDWGDFDRADSKLEESESPTDTDGGLGDWRSSTSGEDDGLEGSPTDVGGELDDWRDDDGDDDGLDELQQSTDDGGLSDWRTSDADEDGSTIDGLADDGSSGDGSSSDGSIGGESSEEDFEDDIEAAFQEAMEQAKDEDDGSSIDDLLE